MKTEQRDLLERQGYLVLERFISDDFLRELTDSTEALFESEGENAGSEFRQEPKARRLANLVAKGEVYQRLVTNPEVLSYVGSVLGPRFKLSSLNARSANALSWS